MAYQDELLAKRQQAAQENKEQSELRAMLTEMKKMQMASLMGSQGKSTVILTDQTDLGDKLKGMVDSFKGAVESIDTTKLNAEQIDELKQLKNGITSLTRAVLANKPDNSALIKAIQSLKLEVEAPIVNVPDQKAPIIQVAAPDLRPLQDTMREVFQPEEEKIDLDCYRAQDIMDNGDIQYVGFLNTEGDWYIIENNVSNNSMRYVFGSGNYAEAFSHAGTYMYQLLNEAVDATA